jgi:hypothetical protein
MVVSQRVVPIHPNSSNSYAGLLAELGIISIIGSLVGYYVMLSSCSGILAGLCQVNVQDQYFGLMEVGVAVGLIFLSLGVVTNVSKKY